jgi:MinD superfamily P-loop ATPase
VSSVRNSDYCVLVAESTPYGISDMMISVEIMKKLKIPFGVVINKSDINDSLIEDYCVSEGITIIAKIPNDINIAKAYSKGIPLVVYDKSWLKEFKRIFEVIKEEKNKYEADSNN